MHVNNVQIYFEFFITIYNSICRYEDEKIEKLTITASFTSVCSTQWVWSLTDSEIHI